MALPPKKVHKITTPPVVFYKFVFFFTFFKNLLFRFFQTKVNLEIWLYENVDIKLEGKIIVCNELYKNFYIKNIFRSRDLMSI